MFESSGVHGVARHFDCTLEDALDIVIDAQLMPMGMVRRRVVLRRLVGLTGSSHSAAGEVLGISRWTVATYRRHLGIE
ncbi:MAG: hypothetical protein ABI894_09155 [Ilumatobacteraceae bacterium]